MRYPVRVLRRGSIDRVYLIAKYRSKSRSKFNLPAVPYFGDSALKSPLFVSRDSNGPTQLTTGGTTALLVKANHDAQSLKEFSKPNRNSLRLFSPHYFSPTLFLSHTPQPQCQHTPTPTPIAFRRVNEYQFLSPLFLSFLLCCNNYVLFNEARERNRALFPLKRNSIPFNEKNSFPRKKNFFFPEQNFFV